jgi:hypothetical protein
VLLVEMHDSRPCGLIGNFKRALGTQALDSTPFIIVGEQSGALDCFHARQARAFRQPVNQQTGHPASIHSRQARDLKNSNRSRGPPRGRGDKAFYRMASRRRQQPGLWRQPEVAEQM